MSPEQFSAIRVSGKWNTQLDRSDRQSNSGTSDFFALTPVPSVVVIETLRVAAAGGTIAVDHINANQLELSRDAVEGDGRCVERIVAVGRYRSSGTPDYGVNRVTAGQAR